MLMLLVFNSLLQVSLIVVIAWNISQQILFLIL